MNLLLHPTTQYLGKYFTKSIISYPTILMFLYQKCYQLLIYWLSFPLIIIIKSQKLMLARRTFSSLIYRNVMTNKNTQIPLQENAERPFSGDKFTNQSIKRLHNSNKKQVIQLLHLMNTNVMHRSHTLINEACQRLLNFQKQMTRQQIVKVLQICIKSQVYNGLFIKHFENQLLHQLNSPLKALIQDFYKQKEAQAELIWKNLQKNSHDIFQLLIDPESMKVEQQNEKQSSQQRQQKQQIGADQTIKERSFQIKTFDEQKWKLVGISLKQFGYIGSLLISLKVQSTNLLKLFMELFLVMANPKHLDAQTLINYIRIANYICSKTQEEYEIHKEFYLKRTHKKINQYQLIFYERTLPLIRDILPTLDNHKFYEIYHQISELQIKSNRPHTYLLQMFKNFTKMPSYKYDPEILKSIHKIMSKRPKLIGKLKEIQSNLLGCSGEIKLQLQQKVSTN